MALQLTPEDVATLKKLAAIAPKLTAIIGAPALAPATRTDSDEMPGEFHNRQVGEAWRQKPSTEKRTDSRVPDETQEERISNAWKRRSA